ncbi:MAG: XRE family transcriptional regulator [Gammaproteobacteria bacterium]|nr:XRE family transcriptional regulator [Gammaproteobacteria bacterium]
MKPAEYKNVSDALFDDPVVAQNLKIRSELMIQLERGIAERGITQKQAAELLGVSQPRVSDLLKGKIEKFSIDMLVNMLASLGKKVTIDAA